MYYLLVTKHTKHGIRTPFVSMSMLDGDNP
jgi:hypothetical protein